MAHVPTHEQISLLEPTEPELPLHEALQPPVMTFEPAVTNREPTIINQAPGDTPAPTPAIAEDPEAVSVSLVDYYTGLQGLLKLAQPLNRNIKFLQDTDQQDSAQYTAIRLKMNLSKEAMEERVGESKEANMRLKKAAKVQFANPVFAQDALVDAELVTRDESKVLARSEYADLTSKYFDPHNRKAMEAKLDDVEARLATLAVRNSNTNKAA